MKKRFGLLGLTMAGIGSMIGSGWLFGAWKAAHLAGPAAILTWPIGFIAILLLAFSYAELGARFPAAGGMVRYTQKSHGSFAGFIAGWANWIAIVSVIPIEAVSSIQYMHSWHFAWVKRIYDTQNHQLTPIGLALAGVLIIIYFCLNYWSVKLFLRSMVAVTLFKICVPLITIISLFWAASYHHHLYLTHHQFMPYGISSVFTAVATAGIVFSFHGFQSAINLSGEAKNPNRNVPLSIFLSMAIAVVIYILLQTVFISVVPLSDLMNGWAGLNYSAPYVHLAIAVNLNWLVILLYIDAFVSPSGTALTYTATTSRMLYGLEKNGYMPKVFGKLHPIYHIPRGAMWANLAVSFVFLVVFKGWGALVAVISVSTIISYVTGPVAAITLRHHPSKLKSPLKIWGLPVIAPLAFLVISLILYWARWPLTGEVIFIILVGLPIYCYYQHKKRWHGFSKQLKSGIWLPCYLLVIAAISYTGSTAFGGHGWLNYGESIGAVIVMALIFYAWALKSGRQRR